jgi:hypothetical protein
LQEQRMEDLLGRTNANLPAREQWMAEAEDE